MRSALLVSLLMFLGCGATLSQNNAQNHPPEVTKSVAPIYPEVARKAGLTGTVVLKYMVTEYGNVRDVIVVSGAEIFRQAAVECVKKWKFRPAQKDGKLIEAWMTQPIRFNLRNKK